MKTRTILGVERLEARENPTVHVSILQVAPIGYPPGPGGDPPGHFEPGHTIISVQGDAAPDVIIVTELPHNRLLVGGAGSLHVYNLNDFYPNVVVAINSGPGRDVVILGRHDDIFIALAVDPPDSPFLRDKVINIGHH